MAKLPLFPEKERYWCVRVCNKLICMIAKYALLNKLGYTLPLTPRNARKFTNMPIKLAFVGETAPNKLTCMLGLTKIKG